MASSTTNASMELIPGMDKLLQYMKAQDNKIKELTEQNKHLKEKNEKLEQEVSLINGEEMENEEKIAELENELDELKEKNNKLKKMIDGLPNDMEDKWWCEKIERWRWDGDNFEEELKEYEEQQQQKKEEEESEEEYIYDVKDDVKTYYLGDDLDEARKQSHFHNIRIKRYIVEDGETNYDDWDIVESEEESEEEQ